MRLFGTTKFNRKIVILIVVLLIITISAGLLSISIYAGWALTHPIKKVHDRTPKEYQLQFEDISFKSKGDDILLNGWWIPSQSNGDIHISGASLIFVHGYTNNRLQEPANALGLAKRLVQEGYNVLMFDLRSHGTSGGTLTTIGQSEKNDVLGAVEYVKDEHKSNQIALIGWSMGAVASIFAAAESSEIQAIVADSPFADLVQYSQSNLSYWSGLPDFPFTPLIINTIPLITGMDPKQISPYQAVSDFKMQKILLIHSKDDEAIPYSNSQIIYDALPNEAIGELWLTEGVNHVESHVVFEKEYQNRVIFFLQQTLEPHK